MTCRFEAARPDVPFAGDAEVMLVLLGMFSVCVRRSLHQHR